MKVTLSLTNNLTIFLNQNKRLKVQIQGDMFYLWLCVLGEKIESYSGK